MPIVVSPTSSVSAASQGAGGATPTLVLQPGTVVNASVLDLLSDDLVRIAIANLTVDVLSEVPLTAGQNLQLAVSQTASGVRLAIVGADTAATAAPLVDAVTLAPEVPVNGMADPVWNAAPASNQLTPLERVAVSAAAETAATQQGSQAPLFADLAAVAGSNSFPPGLRQVVAQVLAEQTNLDQTVDGGAIQNAFQRSGLFFEASLASGALPQAGTVPDLKAALIVLRETLASSLAVAGVSESATPLQSPVPDAVLASSPPVAPSGAGVSIESEAEAPLASALPAESGAHQVLPTQAHVTEQLLASGTPVRIVLAEGLSNAAPHALAPGLALSLLRDIPETRGNPPLGTMGVPVARTIEAFIHASTPPPFRGALPSAQPVASASLTPETPLATAVHRLLDDTDAAIARQTLLQVASLPDRAEAPGPQLDATTPQWHFEIPFATPQGTAMAQFEISRDGGGAEVESAKRVWRARFSLNVEPAGPVHALISFSAERTSVRMWAERPDTAAQLQAGAAQLSQALSQAELTPGDIVIRTGVPPQPAPARPGHFLDRAL